MTPPGDARCGRCRGTEEVLDTRSRFPHHDPGVPCPVCRPTPRVAAATPDATGDGAGVAREIVFVVQVAGGHVVTSDPDEARQYQDGGSGVTEMVPAESLRAARRDARTAARADALDAAAGIVERWQPAILGGAPSMIATVVRELRALRNAGTPDRAADGTDG